MKRFNYKKLLKPGHVCEVCTLDGHQQAELYQLFVGWLEEERLAEYVGVSPKDIVEHALAYGWDIDRSWNTPGLYPRIIRDTIPVAEKAPKVTVSEKNLTIVTRQMDVIEGREQQKRVNDGDVEVMKRVAHEAIAQLMSEGGEKREQVIEKLSKYLPEFKEVWDMPSIDDLETE